MVDHSEDSADLRQLAGNCRRVAATLTDEKDVASLRRMAAEYEATANRIQRPLYPISYLQAVCRARRRISARRSWRSLCPQWVESRPWLAEDSL